MEDKVMKLAHTICKYATLDELIELSGYLQAYIKARVKEDDLHEELI